MVRPLRLYFIRPLWYRARRNELSISAGNIRKREK